MKKSLIASFIKLTAMGVLMGTLFILVIASRADGANPELQHCPKAADAFRSKDYPKAYALAKGRCRDLAALAKWKQLRYARGEVTFQEYMRADAVYKSWPWYSEIRKTAEIVLTKDTPAQDVVVWFSTKPPYGFKGLDIYLTALKKLGKGDVYKKELRNAFENMSLTEKQESALISQGQGMITPKNFVGRFNFYAKDKNIEGARRQIQRCDPALKTYLNVRLALISGTKDAEQAYQRLSSTDQKRLDILEDYVRYLQKKDSPDVYRLLKEHEADFNKDQARFWKIRYVAARDALIHKEYQKAISILKAIHLNEGEGSVEPQFLQGFLAIRFLKDPQEAIVPLQKAYEAAVLSHSKSRCAYWLAEAFEAMGEEVQARHWLAVAQKSPQTFYGQKAFEKKGQPLTLAFIPLTHNDQEEAHMQKNVCFRVLKILNDLQFYEDIPPFLYKIAKTLKNVSEKKTFLRYCYKELPRNVDEIARQMGMISSFKETYPIMDKARGLKNTALTHAIVRKESGFNPDAVSSAGARGLMQLMLDTAQQMCKAMGCKVTERDLTQKPDLNMKIGNYFLNKKLADYDGNLALMLVSYNAGSLYARKWIERYGDPRTGKIDTLTWIELIPFTETRDYLRRVMADKVVYEHLMRG